MNTTALQDDEDTVFCLAWGLCACSVCAPAAMQRDAVERAVNLQNPTGISSRWHISEDTHFATGETNPSPCQDVANRTHWLLSC